MTCFFSSGCSCICFPPFAAHSPPVCTSSSCVQLRRPSCLEGTSEGRGGAGPQLGGLGLTPSSCPSQRPRPGRSSVAWSVSVSCASAGADFMLAVQAGSPRPELPWMVFMFQLYRSRPSTLLEYCEATWFREWTRATRQIGHQYKDRNTTLGEKTGK